MGRIGFAARIFLVVVALSLSETARIVEPAPDSSLVYLHDVPLWVRIGNSSAGECFEVVLDGNALTTTCDADTVLTGVVLAPGPHSLTLVATFLSSSAPPAHVSSFRITAPEQTLPEIPAFVHEYHKWWYNKGVWKDDTRWAGVVTHKLPSDMWTYQEILFDIRPSLLVEVGTRYGGATIFFADVMSRVHAPSDRWKVLTVDIEPAMHHTARATRGVEVLTAPSASLRTQRRVEQLRVEFPGPMFVILDADHGQANVTLELQVFTPLMVEGDYLIVEDSNLDGNPHPVFPGWGPSPWDAVVEFMAMNRDAFSRDIKREFKFGATQSMFGFLQRRGGGRAIMNPLSDEENPYTHL